MMACASWGVREPVSWRPTQRQANLMMDVTVTLQAGLQATMLNAALASTGEKASMQCVQCQRRVEFEAMAHCILQDCG